MFSLPWGLNIFLTVVWLVGITNAINLIDGLDGLAAGITLIALAAFFSIAVNFGQPGAALICCLAAGATAGFLRSNFQPRPFFSGIPAASCSASSSQGLPSSAPSRSPGPSASWYRYLRLPSP